MQSEKPAYLNVKEEERALIHYLQQYKAKKASQCVQGILEETQSAKKNFEKVKSVSIRLLVIAICNLEEMSVPQNQDVERVLSEVETEKNSGVHTEPECVLNLAEAGFWFRRY